MARARAQEQGVRSTDSFRGGVEILVWAGLDKQDDPGAIPDNAFTALINVRHRGTKYTERPGLTKIHTAALDGAVRGIFDPILHGAIGGDPELQNVGPTADCVKLVGYGASGSKLYWLGICSCYGPVIWHFAPDQSPKLQWLPLPLYQDGLHSNAYVRGIMSDGERLWCHVAFSSNSVTSEAHFLQTLAPRNLSAPPSTVTGLFQSESTAGDGVLNSGQGGQAEFANKHFWSSVAVANAPGMSCHVWSWDGLTNTLEDSVAVFDTSGSGSVPVSLSMGVLHEELVCCPTDRQETLSVGIIRKRTLAGVWSTLSLPAGTTSFASRPHDPAVYKGKLYFAGHGNVTAVDPVALIGVILSYDGTNLAMAHSAGTIGVSNGAGLFCPVTLNGLMYYFYSPQTDSTQIYIGKYDGSSFNDTFKDFTADLDCQDARQIRWMRVYQGEIYALFTDSLGGAKLASTVNGNVGGAWAVRAAPTLGTPGDGMASLGTGIYGFTSGVI